MVESNTSYEYSVVLPFEKSFSPYDAKRWMEENWHTGFYFSAAYVLIIFSIKYLMANSKPFSLTKLLLIWNSMLAVFSIATFVRTVPEFAYSYNQGIYHSVCVPR